MKPKAARPGSVIQSSHALVAIACAALLSSGNSSLLAQTPPATQPAVQDSAAPAEAPAPKIPNDQLDSLVAPIALYPDTLLAQTLAAATYPLEIIQLQQWMGKNKNLKDKALADAVAKEKWDPSVQSMAGMPDVVERLATNIQWTTDLGNAFLDQQEDVLAAVQRMRAKAQGTGALKTSQQQTVKTEAVEGNKEVIVIQQPNPEVVYVPSYDPAVVYGPPAYPYYPYTYPGYVPGMGLAMGTGIILGAAWANNNWGNCNWNNGGNININNNNNFNRNNINNVNRNNVNNKNWSHNPSHRGPAPYSNKSTANKFGGTDRGGPNNNRTAGDRSAANKPGGDRSAANKPGGDRSAANKPGGDRSAANKPGGDRSAANKPGGDRSSSANRPSGDRSSAANRSSGGNQIANRQVSSSPSSRSNNAFSSGGHSRSSASASHSRGASSMGGGSRGGGSRGGGRRR
jgi:uncharacterized membrane protein YgcG